MKLFTRISFLALLCTVASIVGCSKNDSMEATSGEFMNTIKEGNIDKAYTMTSPALQKVTNKDQFKNFVTTLGLVDFKSARWFGHNQMDSLATVEGQIIAKDSSVVPIKIHMQNTAGSWKIAGVERIAGFGLAGNISEQFPSNNDVNTLVAAWISLLDRAIKANDFSEFYSNMSKLGQSTTTKEALAAGFKGYVDNKINVSAAMNANAVITPYLSPNVPGKPRVLFVESTFGTTPVAMKMRMKFVLDGGWKLLSMEINF